MALIEKLHPEVVVLAGNWRDNSWPELSTTIKALQKQRVPNVNVVGPVPVWENNLPKQIFLYCKENAPCEIPRYMRMGLVLPVFELNDAMREFSRQQNTHFLSPVDVLCEQGACLTRVGDKGSAITAWDSEHLTDSGSEYLISRFAINQ